MDRWGTYPDWISAVSTALALAGAAVAVYYTYQVNKREEARDDRYEQAQRRAQASKVAIWTAGETSPAFYLRNASELPIYDVAIYRFVKNRQAHPRLDAGPDLWGSVGTLPADQEVRARMFDFTQGDNREGSYAYGVGFTDSEGNGWYRDANGRLTTNLDEHATNIMMKASRGRERRITFTA
jgi:hypothetical protein